MSVFRKPADVQQARKKRAWAFSSGFILAAVGALNLLINQSGFGLVSGVMALILSVSLVGQGMLLGGYSDG